jgi:hypothetical protein
VTPPEIARPILTVSAVTAGFVDVAGAFHLGIKDAGMLAAIGLVAGGFLLLIAAGSYEWVMRAIADRDAERRLEALQRMTWIEQGGIDLRVHMRVQREAD